MCDVGDVEAGRLKTTAYLACLCDSPPPTHTQVSEAKGLIKAEMVAAREALLYSGAVWCGVCVWVVGGAWGRGGGAGGLSGRGRGAAFAGGRSIEVVFPLNGAHAADVRSPALAAAAAAAAALQSRRSR